MRVEWSLLWLLNRRRVFRKNTSLNFCGGQMFYRIVAMALAISSFLFVSPAYAEENTESTVTAPAEMGKVKPYRTFITFQRYSLESNGKPSKPVSNVRLEVTFPNGNKVQLPEGGDYWPVGNGQAQEINRTFEIPWAHIQKDGFGLRVQMVRQGVTLNPCEIEVQSLSQFNRAYVCHTDVERQMKQNIAQEKIAKEGVELRVFTDLNSTSKEIPQNAIALK